MQAFNKVSRQQWVLFVVATLMWISVKSAQFLMRSHAGSLTDDVAFVASIVGISGLIGAIIRFPMGIFSDYLKYKTLIIKVSLFFMMVFGVWFFVERTAWLFYLYNLSMGVAISTWVLFNVLFTKHASSSQTVASIGILAIANNIGSYVAPIVAGRLISSSVIDGKTVYDFSSGSHIVFALMIGSMAFLASLLLQEGPYQSTTKPTLKKTIQSITDAKLWVLSFAGLIVTFMKYATLKFSFETVVKSLGGTPSAIGNIDANYDLLHAIAGIIAGRYLIKKIGAVHTLALGVVLMSLSFILSYFASSLNVFLFFNLFAGFGMGLTYITAMGMVIERVPYEYKNTRMGFFQSIYMLGIYVAPKVATAIEKSINRQGIYLVCAVLGVITIIVLFVFKSTIEGAKLNETEFNDVN